MGRVLATDLPERPEHLAFHARGTWLAAACEEADYAVVLDITTGREFARVTEVTLMAGTTFEFFGDRLLAIWDGVVLCNPIDGSRETLWIEDGVYPKSATLSPEGRLLAIGVRGGLILYDLARKQSRRLETYLDGVPSRPTFSPGGRYVAADFFPYGGPCEIIVWDARDGRRWRTFPAGRSLATVAFRGDTLTLAIGQSGFAMYEPDQGEEPTAIYELGEMPCAMQFRGDGQLAATCYGKGLILLETSTGQVLCRVGSPGNREVGYCQPNADWSVIAGGTDGGILLWASGLT
jgi:hypothetical protein